MSLWLSLALQALLVAVQAVNCVSQEPVTLPGRDIRVLVAVAIGLAQILLHWHAAEHNPDGSDARGSYKGKHGS